MIGLLYKHLYQLPGGGAGGVDGDDELPDALDLPVLQGLDEGHIPVELQAVGVVDIVELVRVQPHDLPTDGELLQKGGVVVLLPVDGPQVLGQRPGPVALELGEGLQVHLHPGGNIRPDLLHGGGKTSEAVPAGRIVFAAFAVSRDHLELGLRIPGRVVVPPEQLPQSLRVLGRVVQEIVVELFCVELFHFFPQPVQFSGLLFLAFGGG